MYSLLLVSILSASSAFAGENKSSVSKKDVADNLVVEMMKIRLMANCKEKVDSFGKKSISTVAECRLEILDQLSLNYESRRFKEYSIYLQNYAQSYGISLNT